MQNKLKPKQPFNEKLFNQNFYRMDTFATNWINRDTLFQFILDKAIATDTIDLNNMTLEDANVTKPNFWDYWSKKWTQTKRAPL